jgi:hypothetical protein
MWLTNINREVYHGKRAGASDAADRFGDRRRVFLVLELPVVGELCVDPELLVLC